ncbi:VCBS repeat-containing protein, partial [Candidatus Pacearchaeota archaeon]|nr:VCBS repeat-containing protein [Candidatus Pacearchaeota archaeon]
MEKKSLLLLVLISFLVFSVSLSFVSAYTFNDVLNGKVSLSDYIKEKITGKAVVQDAEAKGFTSQGTWLKSWIPNLKSVYNGEILIGDFNGDGKTDIGVYDGVNGNWTIANSNGNGFTSQGTWLKSWIPKSDYGEGNTFTGDFNGDGKTDIGVYDAMNGNWLIALSTGTGFSTKTQGWLSGWLAGYSGNTFTGDFNGDGKT